MTTPLVLRKADLVERYDEILTRGLDAEQLAHWRAHGTFGSDVLVQSTSGSSGGAPLLIPRTRADALDLFSRLLRPYLARFGEVPARVALLGGISHTEAALKLRVGTTVIGSYELAQLDEIIALDPEVISCYPSVLRELLVCGADAFPSLRGIKLGGERILASDLEKTFRAFPDVLVVEQFGSAEMPGVGIGVHTPEGSEGLVLQRDRFDFLLRDDDDWQPLVVRDRFAGLLFPIDAFYDTRDEIRVRDDRIVEVRRIDDPANALYPHLDALLRDGLTLCQIDLERGVLRYEGELPNGGATVRLNGLELRPERGGLRRLPRSNKMPWFAPRGANA
jgi:hypothetical protein